ncbi:MAG TPA: XRE family transcriptional regulator [Beijerinckiaceae bacterium]
MMSASSAFMLTDVICPDGTIEVGRLTDTLRISVGELRVALDLPADGIYGLATERRLRDMVEIIGRVLPWAGSAPQAFAWYRAQPLPSFGDQTAEDLVKAGQAEAVKAYLSRIAISGYA